MAKKKTRQPCNLLEDLTGLDHISRQPLTQTLIRTLSEYAADWALMNAKQDPLGGSLIIEASDPGVNGALGAAEAYWLRGGSCGPILVLVPQYSYPDKRVCGLLYGYFALDYVRIDGCRVSPMRDNWGFGEIKFSAQLGNAALGQLFYRTRQMLRSQYC